MTDLTEQWKKGELPEGWYYIKDDDGQIKLAEYSVYCIDRETNETEYDWSCLYEIEQVLAEVPDYIDWRNMVNCACEEHKANTKLLEENAELAEKVKQLKERNDSLNNRDINLCRIANGIRDENFALKELLKECSYRINWRIKTGHEPSDDRKQKLFDEIDQVLRS